MVGVFSVYKQICCIFKKSLQIMKKKQALKIDQFTAEQRVTYAVFFYPSGMQ